MRLITEIKSRHLYDKLSSDVTKIPYDYDRNDALLALCGLVRSGVRRALLKGRRSRFYFQHTDHCLANVRLPPHGVLPS